MDNPVFSEKALEAAKHMTNHVCPDCGEKATMCGYCQKHAWKKAKRACPHCGFQGNKYWGGLAPIAQCSGCKDFYCPF